LEREIWQFPVVLVPFGFAQGRPFGADNKESIVLRPVSSQEAMTARFFPLPEEVLKKIVLRIQALNKISFIFLDVTNKPPGTIEWE
jgi:GMP synthase (glutamine-hydrolysing)